MRIPNLKYVSTTDEILEQVKNWSSNPNRSERQKEQWPDEKIIELLGCDHPNCLRLYLSEGYDDEPVLRFIKTDEIFECIANRQLIPFYYDDLMRLAHFFHLNEFQALLLLIKLRWEEYLKDSSLSCDSCENLDEIVCQYIDDEHEFNLLENTIKTLDSYFDFAKVTGFSDILFSNLIRHILVTRVFFNSIISKEFEVFIGSQKELIALFTLENESYAKVFHARNQQWLRLVQAAELSHLKLEEQRMQDALLEKEWLSEFGEIYYKLLQADYSCESFMQQIDIKKGNPHMTFEQVEEANKAMMETNKENLRMLENEISVSHLFTSVMKGNTKVQVSEDFVNKYKKALRSIWLKTHPDRFIDKHFTPEQLQTLQKFYQEVTEISSTDRLLNPLTFERLQRILEEIDQIYENIGLNITLNSNIKGASLKDKAEWLEKQISLLEKEIAEIKNQLYILATDSTVRQKVESLKSPEIIEATKKQMQDKFEELSQMLKILKKELEKLFEV